MSMRNMQKITLTLTAAWVLILVSPVVGAFTFDLDGSDTLSWFEDFDNNDNGWRFDNGTAISNTSLTGQADGGGTCAAPVTGAMSGFLHLDEDDGVDGYGFQLGGIATVDLGTPIDLSAGSMTLYAAFHNPTGNSPRSSVRLINSGGGDITLSWLSGFRMQYSTNAGLGIPGCCGARCECGSGAMCGDSPLACPNGQTGGTCTPLQFLMRFDDAGNVTVKERNLAGNPGAWREMFTHTLGGSDQPPTLLDRVYVYMESDSNGGNRLEAIGGTLGGGLSAPAEVGAFEFDLTGGDTTLTWMDDFFDNRNGWTLSGTEISNLARLGRIDRDIGGAGNCSQPQEGGNLSYLHIGEDDGDNGFSGNGPWAEAQVSFHTPIDLSGGPVSIYMAMWSPSGGSPRQIVRFSAPGDPDDNISWDWLSTFQSQMYVDCPDAEFGVCPGAAADRCGDLAPNACPHGQAILGCNPNQFRLTLDASGDVELLARDLFTGPDTWQVLQDFNNADFPHVIGDIRIGLASDWFGGERVHAIGGTQGFLAGAAPPPNAVENFRLYSD